MQVAGLTNKGLSRPRNEDSLFAEANSDIAILVVADGMGGHRAGNVASDLAVSSARKFWEKLNRSTRPSGPGAREQITDLVRDANRRIIAEAGSSAGCRGMGTTLTVGLLCGNRLTIGHVGDSRAYLICDGRIEMLTSDHSLLQQLIASGQVRPEEAKNHPQRHVLTRALGASEDPDIDISELEVEQGSLLLLCTDGLTGMVSDEEILEACSEQPDPPKLAEKLVDLANARGGYDNITVVIAGGIGGQIDK